ncbi:MAG: FRG domain-containing protein [Betaproteobacteria bacterium]|nr:FRG domain-containing protein [Betaproteobacteria bacterium]
MNKIRVIPIHHWEDFVSGIEEQEGWAFRGLADARWPLFSSLSRRLRAFSNDDPSLWPLREERALRVFRRKAHIFVQDATTLDDTLRCLALMQHHGAPTRLLDFTKSPFVAAFFALEGTTGESAVYGLNTPALWSAAPDFDGALRRDEIDPRVPGNFERFFLHNRQKLVWFGEPAEMDHRLVAQSGLFVMPGVLDLPLEEILTAYSGSVTEPLLVKYVFSAELRARAMAALYRMNVTSSSLFPDLEGLSRSIAYELEVIWPRLVEDFRSRHRHSK